MTQLKTLTDFKKFLANGGSIRLISVYGEPAAERVAGVRKAERMQTNGVYFEGGSYLEFPKASLFRIIGNQAQIYAIENGEKVRALVYEIIL